MSLQMRRSAFLTGLTETLAPTDFAIAAPIYFQLEADGTVSILTFELDEEGNLVLDESGAPILVETAQGSDNTVVMVDEYTGTDILTTSEDETTTTTTTAEEMTTEPKNTAAGNGEHTPTTSAVVSAETTAQGGGATGTEQTTGASGSQTATTAKNNNSGSSSNSKKSQSISSTPKTDNVLAAILIPAGVALAVAIVTGSKRKRK